MKLLLFLLLVLLLLCPQEYTPLQREDGQTVTLSISKPRESADKKANALQLLHEKLKQERQSKSRGLPEKRKVKSVRLRGLCACLTMRACTPRSACVCLDFFVTR